MDGSSQREKLELPVLETALLSQTRYSALFSFAGKSTSCSVQLLPRFDSIFQVFTKYVKTIQEKVVFTDCACQSYILS